jgi:hypothetical protein
MTYWVTRREDGGIAAAYKYEQPDIVLEVMADDAPELLAFLNPPSPVPASITRRQCARQMLFQGFITPAEALAMTKTGEPPSMVAAGFAQMAPDEAVLAEIDFAADTYQRENPLLVSLMTATGADAAAIDQFFRDAAVR